MYILYVYSVPSLSEPSIGRKNLNKIYRTANLSIIFKSYGIKSFPRQYRDMHTYRRYILSIFFLPKSEENSDLNITHFNEA